MPAFPHATVIPHAYHATAHATIHATSRVAATTAIVPLHAAAAHATIFTKGVNDVSKPPQPVNGAELFSLCFFMVVLVLGAIIIRPIKIRRPMDSGLHQHRQRVVYHIPAEQWQTGECVECGRKTDFGKTITFADGHPEIHCRGCLAFYHRGHRVGQRFLAHENEQSLWTEAEDTLVRERVRVHGRNFKLISNNFMPDRSPESIMERWHHLVMPNGDHGATTAALGEGGPAHAPAAAAADHLVFVDEDRAALSTAHKSCPPSCGRVADPELCPLVDDEVLPAALPAAAPAAVPYASTVMRWISSARQYQRLDEDGLRVSRAPATVSRAKVHV